MKDKLKILCEKYKLICSDNLSSNKNVKEFYNLYMIVNNINTRVKDLRKVVYSIYYDNINKTGIIMDHINSVEHDSYSENNLIYKLEFLIGDCKGKI